MDKLLTKTRTLLFSGILGCGELFVLVLFLFFPTTGFVGYYGGVLDQYYLFFLIFIPVLLFSLITYKLRDEVFGAWVKFAKWWVLGTILLVLITPAQDQSFIPLDKEMISLFSTGMFTLVSLIVIVATAVSLRGKK